MFKIMINEINNNDSSSAFYDEFTQQGKPFNVKIDDKINELNKKKQEDDNLLQKLKESYEYIPIRINSNETGYYKNGLIYYRYYDRSVKRYKTSVKPQLSKGKLQNKSVGKDEYKLAVLKNTDIHENPDIDYKNIGKLSKTIDEYARLASDSSSRIKYQTMEVPDYTKELYKPKFENKNKDISEERKSSICIEDYPEALVVKNFNPKILIEELQFKVLDYKKSGKLFGFSNIKKGMVGKFFKASKIDFQIDVKKSKERENTITLINDGKNIRFSMNDIKIIYPNFNGWHLKKGKYLHNGVFVRVANNKGSKEVPVGYESEIINVKNIGNNKFYILKYNNKLVGFKRNNLKIIKNNNLENNGKL